MPEPLGETTEGELGRLEFSYGHCPLGCPIDAAWLVGTTELVTIRDSEAPREEVIASSSDPSVLTVEQMPEPRDRLLTVTAVAPGQADIVLHTPLGARVDYTTIRVNAAARIAVRVRTEAGNWTSPDQLALGAGERALVGATAIAEDGSTLRSTLGIEMATTDPTVAKLSFSVDGDAEQLAELAEENVIGELRAESAGRARILARMVEQPDGPQGELPVVVEP